MTIDGLFSESLTLVLTFTGSPRTASTSPTTSSTPSQPAPAGDAAATGDTAQISPLAAALSQVDPNGSARADEVFKTLDADGDGSVSRQEFDDNAGKVRHELRTGRGHGHHGHHGRNLDKLFSRIDANGDGTLSQDEVTAAVKSHGGHGRPTRSLDDMFKTIDANGDGSISREELGTALGLKGAPASTPATDATPAIPGASDPAGTTEAVDTASEAQAAETPATGTPAAETSATEPPATAAATTTAAPSSFTITLSFSYTAIALYHSVSQAPLSSSVGTRVNAAA